MPDEALYRYSYCNKPIIVIVVVLFLVPFENRSFETSVGMVIGVRHVYRMA